MISECQVINLTVSESGLVIFIGSLNGFSVYFVSVSHKKFRNNCRIPGHFEQLCDDVILLQLPESFSLLFSCENKGYCFLNLSRIDKIK